MSKLILVILIVVVGVSKSYSQSPKSAVLVGVMEDNREELVNWKKGPSKARVILPLFEKRGTRWVPCTALPRDILWTIAFDGQDKGTLKSQRSAEVYPFGPDAYTPEPQAGQFLTIGKPSKKWSGWQNTLFNRPLVLVSNGAFKDPEQWKPFRPSESELKIFRSAFRSEYPKVTNCDSTEKPLPNPWKYKDSDIMVTSAYHSNQGYSLVNMFLQGGNCGMLDGPFIEQLFLFHPNNAATHITVADSKPLLKDRDFLDQTSLYLVDAGDYDGNGKSEIVFFVSGYNQDGYVMFYDSFQRSVIFTWSYH